MYDDPSCYCSYSCAIGDGEEVVLTGGSDDGRSSVGTVTRYNMQGQASPLPSLNTARLGHACGTIKKSDGSTVVYSYYVDRVKLVSCNTLILVYWIMVHSVPECGFEVLKTYQAPAHIWELPR